jgi:beta,beta-carotene 9',10'-dioxygenase
MSNAMPVHARPLARDASPAAPVALRPAAPTGATIYDSCVLDGPFEGEAIVEGDIPSWLSGRLLRTAPAVFELGGWRAAHWFDGLGMLYRLDVQPGRVAFRQSLMQTEALAHARAGKMPVSTFAGKNERSFFRRLVQPIPQLTDNTNVHIVPTPEGWLAMTETTTQYLIDEETLGITRTVRHEDALGKYATMLAHPELDRTSREIVNLATVIGPTTKIIPFKHRLQTNERVPMGTISLREVPYMHSFALTPTKVIVVAPPLLANPLSFLWSNKGYIDHFRWSPERGTRVFVMDRATGQVIEHECDPFFVFHTVNAHDEGDSVVLDLCAFPDTSVIDRIRSTAAGEEPLVAGKLERLRIPARGRVTREVLDDGNLEFPTVDRSRVSGRRHGIVWGASFGHDGERRTVDITRHDLESGRTARFGRDRIAYGEPVFVGRPGSETEGDGVLLAVGSDLTRGKAEMVVLDATTLEPLATAKLPIPLPLGFHGSFRRSQLGARSSV